MPLYAQCDVKKKKYVGECQHCKHCTGIAIEGLEPDITKVSMEGMITVFCWDFNPDCRFERRGVARNRCPFCDGINFSHYRCGKPIVRCLFCKTNLQYHIVGKDKVYAKYIKRSDERMYNKCQKCDNSKYYMRLDQENRKLILECTNCDSWALFSLMGIEEQEARDYLKGKGLEHILDTKKGIV